jgi:acetyltransferase-like isoleucine patch superfamily enzyme
LFLAYLKVITSFIRLSIKKFSAGKGIEFHPVQSFSHFSKIKLKKNSVVNFGRNIQISSGCNIFVAGNSNLSIGDKTYFNERCILSVQDQIFIGKNCLFGPDVKLYDNNHLFKKGIGVIHGKHKTNPILIGDNCWIASNVVVLPGTTIGDNCIIGAGVIVKGNVPDNSIIRPSTENLIQQIK